MFPLLHPLSPHRPFVPPFDLLFILLVICPPSFPLHPSESARLSTPPSILFSMSLMIPASVSASRLSALKLSRRRSVAGRNPVLRGNYLLHRFLKRTPAHIAGFNCTHADVHAELRLARLCADVGVCLPVASLQKAASFTSPPPLLGDICCSFQGWSDPPHLPIESAS